MTRIYKQAIVGYSTAQMYSLVNDIEAYPEFLPWCVSARIIENNQLALTASISVAVGKLKKTFTTANTMKLNHSISMNLIHGPFRELTGCWQFEECDHGCLVSFDIQFEFKNKLIKHTFSFIFQKIFDSLVDAFVRRAEIIYGGK